MQQVAKLFDPPLVLVSPVPSGEGPGSWGEKGDGSSGWLDEFLGNCTHVVKACDPSLIKCAAAATPQPSPQSWWCLCRSRAAQRATRGISSTAIAT